MKLEYTKKEFSEYGLTGASYTAQLAGHDLILGVEPWNEPNFLVGFDPLDWRKLRLESTSLESAEKEALDRIVTELDRKICEFMFIRIVAKGISDKVGGEKC